ncbi:MAG TPA: hypothetical protein VKA36_10910 [Solirubrobacterales bacterium]|nr:hypothetical protein [Solirubrobacterales bacterium]
MRSATGFASAGDREVCPECGRDAYGAWCDCGFELTSVERLPTADEYAAGGRGDTSPPTGAPAPDASAVRRMAIITAVVTLVIGAAIAILLGAGVESTSGP